MLAGAGARATGGCSGTAPLRLGAPSASPVRADTARTQSTQDAPAVATAAAQPAAHCLPAPLTPRDVGDAGAVAAVAASPAHPQGQQGGGAIVDADARADVREHDSRGWRNNPAYKRRGGWRIKRADAMTALKDAKARKDAAAVSAAEALLRRDDHRKPAGRSDARAADAEVTGSGRSGRQGQGGKGGRRSKARTSSKRGKREKQGVVRRGRQKKTGPARAVTFSPAPVIRRIRR